MNQQTDTILNLQTQNNEISHDNLEIKNQIKSLQDIETRLKSENED
jgi:hypothetical protein